MEMTFNANDIAKARQLFDTASSVAILAHAGPDGDALGSSLALYHLLSSLGKTTNVIYPNDFAANLRWMPAADRALVFRKNPDAVSRIISDADLILICDLNELTRLNTGSKTDGIVGLSLLVQQSSAPKLLIDHHEFPQADQFDLLFSRPELSSASEVVYRLIDDMRMLELAPFDFFQCVLTGMMTDTGFFHYGCQYPDFFHIVADIVARGVNITLLTQNISCHEREQKIRLTAYLLDRKLELFPEFATAITILTDDEKRRFNYESGDAEGYVNIPLDIEGINRSIFIKEERQDGIVKLSFRSQGDVNVEQLARLHFNGGGHFNAAGGEMRDLTVQQVRDMLIHILKDETRI